MKQETEMQPLFKRRGGNKNTLKDVKYENQNTGPPRIGPMPFKCVMIQNISKIKINKK